MGYRVLLNKLFVEVSIFYEEFTDNITKTNSTIIKTYFYVFVVPSM